MLLEATLTAFDIVSCRYRFTYSYSRLGICFSWRSWVWCVDSSIYTFWICCGILTLYFEWMCLAYEIWPKQYVFSGRQKISLVQCPERVYNIYWDPCTRILGVDFSCPMCLFLESIKPCNASLGGYVQCFIPLSNPNLFASNNTHDDVTYI